MIKNLNQLKKAMKGNPRFQIIAHCRKECVGEIRQVTQANTTGFYSAVAGDPEDWTRTANQGLGLILWWNRAPFWSFQDGHLRLQQLYYRCHRAQERFPCCLRRPR